MLHRDRHVIAAAPATFASAAMSVKMNEERIIPRGKTAGVESFVSECESLGRRRYRRRKRWGGGAVPRLRAPRTVGK